MGKGSRLYGDVHPLKMKTEWNFNILKRRIDNERQKRGKSKKRSSSLPRVNEILVHRRLRKSLSLLEIYLRSLCLHSFVLLRTRTTSAFVSVTFYTVFVTQ